MQNITKSDLLRKFGIPDLESTPIVFIDLSFESKHKNILGTQFMYFFLVKPIKKFKIKMKILSSEPNTNSVDSPSTT